MKKRYGGGQIVAVLRQADGHTIRRLSAGDGRRSAICIDSNWRRGQNGSRSARPSFGNRPAGSPSASKRSSSADTPCSKQRARSTRSPSQGADAGPRALTGTSISCLVRANVWTAPRLPAKIRAGRPDSAVRALGMPIGAQAEVAARGEAACRSAAPLFREVDWEPGDENGVREFR